VTFNCKKYLEKYIDETITSLNEIKTKYAEQILQIVDTLLAARDRGHLIFLMGNGGSASTASHFAGDLNKGALPSMHTRRRFRAISLNDNIPLMLAWANDSCYDNIFIEQLKNMLNEGDIVIGISGSGESKNILQALEYANAHGALTIGFTGRYRGRVGKICKVAKICLVVPAERMEQIEDMHLLIEHLIITMIREKESHSEF